MRRRLQDAAPPHYRSTATRRPSHHGHDETVSSAIGRNDAGMTSRARGRASEATLRANDFRPTTSIIGWKCTSIRCRPPLNAGRLATMVNRRLLCCVGGTHNRATPVIGVGILHDGARISRGTWKRQPRRAVLRTGAVNGDRHHQHSRQFRAVQAINTPARQTRQMVSRTCATSRRSLRRAAAPQISSPPRRATESDDAHNPAGRSAPVAGAGHHDMAQCVIDFP